MNKWTRRAFIGTGTLVGGGFVLGVVGATFAPSRHSVTTGDPAETGELTTWILVTPDNLVTILVPHCEMGQGTQTALAMMAAEEMDADWDQVRVKEAPALDAYANAYLVRAFAGGSIPGMLDRAFDYGTYRVARWYGTQATGGSTAVRGTGQYGMAVAGAAARQMLVAAAAAFRRRCHRLHGGEFAGDPCHLGQERHVRRTGERGGPDPGAVASGAQERRSLHLAPNGAPAVRHQTQG
jgi:isoquinoline 1-oxidoreductase beta subunit